MLHNPQGWPVLGNKERILALLQDQFTGLCYMNDVHNIFQEE